MILIISENHDSQTDMVMDWLQDQQSEVVLRINDADWIVLQNITLDGNEISYSIEVNTVTGVKRTIHSKDIDAIWYRRGDFSIFNRISVEAQGSKEYVDELWSYVKGSNDVAKEFLHRHLRSKQIGNYYDNSTNKLLNLELARSVGFKIPPTLITSTKGELKNFMDAHSDIITKGLKVNGFEIPREFSYSCLTSLVSQEDLQQIPEAFAPSLFQKVIPKLFEIRVFYFNGKMHAVAMMTQRNVQTQLDFRNYDTTKPTRMLPFQMNNDFKNKVSEFMNGCTMSTGSLDFIYTPNEDYYFLEVNPVGQFGFISNWCNVNLEKTIATELKAVAYGNC